jgi:hypothetical protein
MMFSSPPTLVRKATSARIAGIVAFLITNKLFVLGPLSIVPRVEDKSADHEVASCQLMGTFGKP